MVRSGLRPASLYEGCARLASPRNAFNYSQQWQNFVLDQLYTVGVYVTCVPSVTSSVPAPSPTWQHFLLFCTFCCCCIRFHFGFFFAVSRPASEFRLLLMMIMMDNCEGLIMMTLCVMRKLASTRLDTTQLDAAQLAAHYAKSKQSWSRERESFTAGRVCQVVTALSGAWAGAGAELELEPLQLAICRLLLCSPFARGGEGGEGEGQGSPI